MGREWESKKQERGREGGWGRASERAEWMHRSSVCLISLTRAHMHARARAHAHTHTHTVKMGGFEINLKKDLKEGYMGPSSTRAPANTHATATGNTIGFSGSRRPHDLYHFKGWRSFEDAKGELLVEVVLIRETGEGRAKRGTVSISS